LAAGDRPAPFRRVADALDPMDLPRQDLEGLGAPWSDQEAVFDSQPAPRGTEHRDVDREDHAGRQRFLVPGGKDRELELDDADAVDAGN